jgi:hypothetical protein
MTTTKAAQEAVTRMRGAWPAHRWGDPTDPLAPARDYGEALLDIADAAAIDAGVTRAIREFPGKFPPPVSELLRYVREARGPRPAPTLPADPANRCPICRQEEATNAVVVDRNGWASCTEGSHRQVWRAT